MDLWNSIHLSQCLWNLKPFYSRPLVFKRYVFQIMWLQGPLTYRFLRPAPSIRPPPTVVCRGEPNQLLDRLSG